MANIISKTSLGEKTSNVKSIKKLLQELCTELAENVDKGTPLKNGIISSLGDENNGTIINFCYIKNQGKQQYRMFLATDLKNIFVYSVYIEVLNHSNPKTDVITLCVQKNFLNTGKSIVYIPEAYNAVEQEKAFCNKLKDSPTECAYKSVTFVAEQLNKEVKFCLAYRKLHSNFLYFRLSKSKTNEIQKASKAIGANIYSLKAFVHINNLTISFNEDCVMKKYRFNLFLFNINRLNFIDMKKLYLALLTPVKRLNDSQLVLINDFFRQVKESKFEKILYQNKENKIYQNVICRENLIFTYPVREFLVTSEEKYPVVNVLHSLTIYQKLSKLNMRQGFYIFEEGEFVYIFHHNDLINQSPALIVQKTADFGNIIIRARERLEDEYAINLSEFSSGYEPFISYDREQVEKGMLLAQKKFKTIKKL